MLGWLASYTALRSPRLMPAFPRTQGPMARARVTISPGDAVGQYRAPSRALLPQSGARQCERIHGRGRQVHHSDDAGWDHLTRDRRGVAAVLPAETRRSFGRGHERWNLGHRSRATRRLLRPSDVGFVVASSLDDDPLFPHGTRAGALVPLAGHRPRCAALCAGPQHRDTCCDRHMLGSWVRVHGNACLLLIRADSQHGPASGGWRGFGRQKYGITTTPLDPRRRGFRWPASCRPSSLPLLPSGGTGYGHSASWRLRRRHHRPPIISRGLAGHDSDR